MEAGVVSAEPPQPFPPLRGCKSVSGRRHLNTVTLVRSFEERRGTMQKCEHTYVCAQGVREESHGSFTASDWKQHMWFSFPTMLKVKHQKEHHFLVSHWNGWSAFSFYWDNSLSLPKVKNVLHSLTVCRLGVELLYQNIYSATEHHNHFKMLYSSVQRRPAVLISNSIFLSGMVQVAIQNNLYMSCADTLFLSWLSSNSFLL